MSSFALALALVSVVGCGDDDATTTTVTAAPTTPTPAPSAPRDLDPLAGLDEVDGDDATILPVAAMVEPPPRGCAPFASAPQRLWAVPGPARVVAVGADGFAIAGYAPKVDVGPDGVAIEGASQDEEVWLVTVRPSGLPRPVLRESLEIGARFVRRAAPGLGALDAGHVGLAITDGAANARFASVHLGGRREAWRLLGHPADQRFSPAVGVHGGRPVIAWTEAPADEPMRLMATALDPTGEPAWRHDLTQPGMGACAPTFAARADGPPALLFLDPHAGTSAILTAEITTDPPPVRVLRPVSHVYDPALLAGGVIGERTLVGYTAVGQAAATAVGLVWSEGDRQPETTALVPSAGYGALHVSAATAPRRVVFAADRPTAREREAPREIVLRVAIPGEAGVELGEPVVVRGPNDGPASLASLARHEDGTYALVFTSTDGVYARFLRCDEG
ncbi:MAG: hypothetical protein KF901_34075 [Myxococcales bacterium]|nr:hypothetical protein [Myxococcales bacterium]